MGELTSAVSDEEIIPFFMSAIVPYVMRYQKPILMSKTALDAPSGSSPCVQQAKEDFIERLSHKLEVVMEECEQEEVHNVTIINVSNNLTSRDYFTASQLSSVVWSTSPF